MFTRGNAPADSWWNSCGWYVCLTYSFSTFSAIGSLSLTPLYKNKLFPFLEMGIGKTLQTIGLILANPPVSGPKTTMVVCPVSVMSNWVQQINNFVKPGILNVQLYHGECALVVFSSILSINLGASFALIHHCLE